MKNRYLNQIVTDIKQWGATFPLQLTEHAIFFKYYESEFPIPENDEKYIMHVAENIDLTNQVHRSRIFNQMIYMLKDRPERELILEAQYAMAEDKLKFCHFMKGLILEYYNRFKRDKKELEKAKATLDSCILWAEYKISLLSKLSTSNTIVLPVDNEMFEEKVSTSGKANEKKLIKYVGNPNDKKAALNFQRKFISIIDFFSEGTPSEQKLQRKKLKYLKYTDAIFTEWLCQIDIFDSLKPLDIKDKISRSRKLDAFKKILVEDPFPTYLQEALERYFMEK